MGEDETNIKAARSRAAEQQTQDRARSVEWKFHRGSGNVRQNLAQESRSGRVEIDHRLAFIERVEDRRKCRVAGPEIKAIGHQRNAVSLEYVECVLDLA